MTQTLDPIKSNNALHRIHAEPREGSVIRFSGRYSTGPRVYHYAAIRAGGRWYTTGSSCPRQGHSWKSLLRLINDMRGRPQITILEDNGVSVDV